MPLDLSSTFSRDRLYVAASFALGILLTLGYKDVYPDLESRFRRQMNRLRSSPPQTPYPEMISDPIKLSDSADPHALDYEVKTGVEGTIGNTPLIRIKSLSEATGCEILAKAEFLNGAGNSPKDRVALEMIKTAEEQGLLTPHSGDVIYEGTVGSTGISLAAICRARGYLAHMYVARTIAKILHHLALHVYPQSLLPQD